MSCTWGWRLPTGAVQLPGTEAEAAEAAQCATAAVFYSVSSTQKGLAGVDLGHFLIEKVQSVISAARQYATHPAGSALGCG